MWKTVIWPCSLCIEWTSLITLQFYITEASSASSSLSSAPPPPPPPKLKFEVLRPLHYLRSQYFDIFLSFSDMNFGRKALNGLILENQAESDIFRVSCVCLFVCLFVCLCVCLFVSILCKCMYYNFSIRQSTLVYYISRSS